MTRELKACPPRRAIIEAALISAAKCLEAEGKRQTWSDLAAAVDAELSSLPNPEGQVTVDAVVEEIERYGEGLVPELRIVCRWLIGHFRDPEIIAALASTRVEPDGDSK